MSTEANFTTEYHQEKHDTTEQPQFSVGGVQTEFEPHYYPKHVEVSKERDLVREKGICLGEWVNDIGSKNREVTIEGYIRTPELEEFHQILDLGNKYNLICMQWQGEVLLADSIIEGPHGVDVETKHWLYEYTLEFVSTGKSENPINANGIIDNPNERRAANDDLDDTRGFLP